MSRKQWWVSGLVLLGLALSAVLLASSWWIWSRQSSSGQGSGSDALPYVPLAADKSLGVNADLSRLDAAERQEALAAMEAAGFRWLRQRIGWDRVAAEQGVYDWAVWDEIVEVVTRHNLRLIAVLDGSPAWARTEGDAGNPLAPPIEARDFGDFAEALAARYGDVIDHYQIWDEPNIAPHWGGGEIDPAAYRNLLREGAIRIRAADPGAVIVLAALAPTVEPGGANMSEMLFLDALYRQGAAEWFDVVAVQPYGLEDALETPPNPARLNWQRAALIREVMETHEDWDTAVWAVSSGLTEDTESIEAAIERVREDWPWLGPMLWAAWSPTDRQGEYALRDTGGKPNSAYQSLQALATSPPMAWPGVYRADHASGLYEGEWRVTPSGADIGASGDVLRIPFRGTRLDLTVRRGDYRAFLFVSVDGQGANALPRDTEGRAYVVLYDPLRQVETVTLAHDLPNSDHVAEIVAERGWGQWAIAGWAAYREEADTLYWLPVVLGLAAFLVFGVTVYRAWGERQTLMQSIAVTVARYRAVDDRIALLITGGAAVLSYAMVGTIPTLGTLSLLALLLLLRPEMGLPLIAFALPFYQLGRPLLGKVFSMVEILTILTALGWVVSRVFGISKLGEREQAGDGGDGAKGIALCAARLTKLDWGVLALVIVGAVSLLWSEQGRVAAREFRTVILGASIFYGLLRVLVPAHETKGQVGRGLWRVVDAWVLGGALIASVGLLQWAFGQNVITAEGVWRVRGFYGSPNNLALYLGKMFPLAIAVGLWGQAGRRRWAYGAAALLMAAAILLTYSRGAWVIGVPVSLLFLAALRGRRTLAVAVGVVAVVAVLVFFVAGVGRLTSLLDTSVGTTFFRLQLWQSSWAMIRDHPLLGVGLDNFLYAYRTQYVLPTAWEEFNLSHPHNLVFDFWLRLGLPGLLVLLWLVVGFFRRGWLSYRRLPESSGRLLALGLMAGMVNLLAHGLVDNAFFLVDLAFTFMLFLALVQALKVGSGVVPDS